MSAEIAQEEVSPNLAGETMRFVERLLYDYKTFDASIRSLQLELEQIVPGRSRSFVKAGAAPGHSPVDTSEPERWATERIEGRRALHMQRQLRDKLRWQAGIRDALRLADDQGRRVYELRYAEERPHHQAARMMGLPQRSYYRAHRKFLVLAAKCLGQA